MDAADSIRPRGHNRKRKSNDDRDHRDPFSTQITIDEIITLLTSPK